MSVIHEEDYEEGRLEGFDEAKQRIREWVDNNLFMIPGVIKRISYVDFINFIDGMEAGK